MIHTCHARGCKTPVNPELLMCLKHWRMVPNRIKNEVRMHYVDGQCDFCPAPSKEWHEAADAAIRAVAEKEREQRTRTP